MTRVLVAGESWVTQSTHFKGFDSFTSVTYHVGLGPLRQALEAGGVEVHHLPAHDVPAHFPSTRDELARFDVVILSDIGTNSILLPPCTWLSGQPSVDRLRVLADWVTEGGGGLMMAGGYLSFQGFEAKARFRGTAVEEVLPAVIAPWDDRVEVPQGLRACVVDKGHPVLAGTGEQWPPLLGYNRFELKPDSHLVATIGPDPLLAVRQAGAGRTLAWASDVGPHWCPDEFAQWPGYGLLFTQCARWLAGEL